MIEVIQLLTLVAREVTLEAVQEAFNGFTNSKEAGSWYSTLFVATNSEGGRFYRLRQFELADDTDRVVEIEGAVERVNCYWVEEVEFVSATSGSKLRWVATERWAQPEVGAVRGEFSFTQGTPGYFGAYYRAFTEAVQSLS